MSDTDEKKTGKDRRTEPRRIVDEYYSVVLQPLSQGPLYQFKIRDVSDSGLCILVKKDSAVLEFLNVGDIIDMTYYTDTSSRAGVRIKTKIIHMTPKDTGKYQGHYLVGLSVLSPTPLPLNS
ncbi:MAG: PilZ domain-containing protein [Desulfobacterales bacterium]